MIFLQKAEKALKYYKGYKGDSEKEDDAIFKEFERLKAIVTEQKQEEKFVAAEFCKSKTKLKSQSEVTQYSCSFSLFFFLLT